MKQIRVAFINFWPDFDPRSNNLLALLRRRFHVDVEDDAARATVLFESYFKPRAPADAPASARDDRIKIFFSGEPRNLPVKRHHAVISTNVLSAPGHFRYPLWMLSFQLIDDPENVDRRRFGQNITYEMTQRELRDDRRSRFACAMFNNGSHYRYEAIRQLGAYGPVDVYGRWFGNPVCPKLPVLQQYRMNVCLESTIQPGYVTEKAIEARAAGCVPLWWGDPTYRLDFHERAIVNLYEYDMNVERMFEEVDFKALASTPLLKRHPDDINAEAEQFLYDIVSSPPARLFLDVVVGTPPATTQAPAESRGQHVAIM